MTWQGAVYALAVTGGVHVRLSDFLNTLLPTGILYLKAPDMQDILSSFGTLLAPTTFLIIISTMLGIVLGAIREAWAWHCCCF